ncbi:gluconate 2-dehydrogenase subunit 3 family protein [Terriglobus tenax]|uniref:gluconate 2-dehydrogenase subunit 3 family protein n=1 Tax=Terriglobus tenax TaxID=1111115 RepID=UPI0021DFE92C|nr:gluconate 2-dehydrogenase subunit 3 family protein [Terriglobus tenax]
MQRRDVLRLLGSAAAISALPQEALALLGQASAQASAARGLKTLNAHQDATVTTIAELIIPETDTPGAKGAKVNEFIDLLLSEWFEPVETREFLAGLEQIDVQSRKQFSASFVECSASQQVALLKQLDAAAMEFAQKQKQAAKSGTQPPPMDFFYQIKKLTLAGYYTSEIGFEKELGKSIIPPGHAGCAPLPEVSK